MSEIDLTREFDSRVWAKEFMRLYNENHQADVGEWIDEDLMITWFANAIMAGHDVAIDRLKDLILSGRPKKKECVCDAMTLEGLTMSDDQLNIEDAVKYFNGELREAQVTEIHAKPLVDLAQRYLCSCGKCHMSYLLSSAIQQYLTGSGK